MELDIHQAILAKALSNYPMRVTFENLHIENAGDIVEWACFHAIKKIYALLGEDELEDFECMDNIVCVLEELGIGGNGRHDFG